MFPSVLWYWHPFTVLLYCRSHCSNSELVIIWTCQRLLLAIVPVCCWINWSH